MRRNNPKRIKARVIPRERTSKRSIASAALAGALRNGFHLWRRCADLPRCEGLTELPTNTQQQGQGCTSPKNLRRSAAASETGLSLLCWE